MHVRCARSAYMCGWLRGMAGQGCSHVRAGWARRAGWAWLLPAGVGHCGQEVCWCGAVVAEVGG